MAYRRAPLTDSGELSLTPGTFFFDTEWKRLEPVLGELKELQESGAFAWGPHLWSGREGQILNAVTVLRPFVLPRALSTGGESGELGTGPWWVLPEGQSIEDVSEALYGTRIQREPRGFWEWVVDTFPELSQSTIKTVESVTWGVGELAKTAVLLGGLALFVVVLSKSRRR